MTESFFFTGFDMFHFPSQVAESLIKKIKIYEEISNQK